MKTKKILTAVEASDIENRHGFSRLEVRDVDAIQGHAFNNLYFDWLYIGPEVRQIDPCAFTKLKVRTIHFGGNVCSWGLALRRPTTDKLDKSATLLEFDNNSPFDGCEVDTIIVKSEKDKEEIFWALRGVKPYKMEGDTPKFEGISIYTEKEANEVEKARQNIEEPFHDYE